MSKGKERLRLCEEIELLDTSARSESVASVGRHYWINESTVCKPESNIRSSVSAPQSTKYAQRVSTRATPDKTFFSEWLLTCTLSILHLSTGTTPRSNLFKMHRYTTSIPHLPPTSSSPHLDQDVTNASTSLISSHLISLADLPFHRMNLMGPEM